MASIIASKRFNDHFELTITLNLKEFLELRGSIDNLHIIPGQYAQTRSTVYERGRRKCSKYFLIPKDLRDGLLPKKNVSCLRTNFEDKILWTYIMKKELNERNT